MILKCGIREWNKHGLSNRLSILLLMATFIIGIFGISIICYQYRFYKVINQLTKGNGVFLLVEDLAFEDGQTLVTNNYDLEHMLGGGSVSSIRYAELQLKIDDVGTDSYQTIFYDDLFTEIYQPTMQEGRWFSENDSVIEAVVTDSCMNIHTGDFIYVDGATGEYTIEVVGIIADGAPILGRSNQFDAISGFSFRNFYAQYTSDTEVPVFLLKQSNIIKVCQSQSESIFPETLNGCVFISFEKDWTQTECEEITQRLKNSILSPADNIYSYTNIRSDSKAYLNELYIQYFPIMLCALILTLLSVLIILMVNGRKSSYDFRIYRLCGCTQKDIRKMMLLQAALQAGIAFILSCVIMILAIHFGELDSLVIYFSWGQIIYCMVITGTMILISDFFGRKLGEDIWKK